MTNQAQPTPTYCVVLPSEFNWDCWYGRAEVLDESHGVNCAPGGDYLVALPGGHEVWFSRQRIVLGTTGPTEQDLTHYDRGSVSGNYAEAYISPDYNRAFNKDTGPKEHNAYCIAYVLGYFATYELFEIPFDYRELFDSAYWSDHGQAMVVDEQADDRGADYTTEAETFAS
jgi:hypothetical protein